MEDKQQLEEGASSVITPQLKSMYPTDKYSLYSSDTEERVSHVAIPSYTYC